ncbi:hypothetical protein FY528_01145 [Hymenobacter lutimineralis]|uniref:Uncharacterized protein n=1 Tax=Hymenobacter lutimineralis TaxID=2606448 RepID=A0A5D6VIY8_9BACT|nr:hypothetical protein [Hymenobacter lutimineralis]TYZ14364.1 hypothetical protein FY528_01145 [Hymenobacter lutimineralis]
MTDSYLRSLGFVSTEPERTSSQLPFAAAWRYQQQHLAQDGTALYIEHPYGIDSCRLSTLIAPLDQQDVLTTLALTDRVGLEGAIQHFYAAHGGIGPLAPVFVPHLFRPYRRAQ